MSDRPLFRERMEAPLTRARRIGERAVESFPIRVWRHFSRNNGFLLSAGMSYFILFALFALLFVVFAGVGFWLGGSTDAAARAIGALIEVANTYIPDLIGENGLVTSEDVMNIAKDFSGVLGVTGVIAIVLGAWTAIGAVTFTRRAVRDIFGLPFDDRPYLLLKLRDLLSGLTFGGALLLGAVLATIGVWTLTQVFALLGWSTTSWVFSAGVRALSILVAFAVDAAALAALVRFLTGTSIPWRAIWPGSLLGGAAMVALQLALGLLLSHGPSNPLLATFALSVGVLLWCRMISVVVLAAASWIAVTAEDQDHPLVEADEGEVRLAEHEALLLAAEVRLRQARRALDDAPWYRRRSARRAVQAAAEEERHAAEDLARERRAQAASARPRWLGIE